MKTALDIQQTFNATTVTEGSGNVYSCRVYLESRLLCEGLGTSLENAEDTAFYATAISLRR